jgi:hypothetical protein
MSMKKKNIEQLFREKLQDYSQLPEEQVWDRISGSLDQKKSKRRVLPLWWRLGGVAAVLIAALVIFFPEDESSKTPEVITDLESGVEKIVTPGEDVPEKQVSEGIMIADTEEAPGKNLPKEESHPESGGRSGDLPDIEPGIETYAAEQLTGRKDEIDRANGEGFLYVKQSPVENPDAQAVSSVVTQNNTRDENQVRSFNEKSVQKIALNSPEEKEEANPIPETVEELKKKSIFEALAQEEEEIEDSASDNRWEVGPRVAPVFFSSLAQGSPIHSSFRDNAKTGNVNMSYGVAVTYEIGKKVKLRSGLHRVDFGYDTKNVSFSSSLTANTTSTIDNINYTLNSKNLVVRSNTSSGKIASESAQDVAGPDPSLNGKMVQEFGYLEVPLELTYQVIDSKIGINLLGGVSSLFLLNNSVTLEANGNITEMGEANNINDLNFSTNFGVGITYRLNNKIQVNLEPMFKYQLNTFSDTSGNFQPFSMGVYSGLNFRF